MPRELRLLSHRHRPLGRKNRLQQRRRHLQELEVARSRRRKAVDSPVSRRKAVISPTQHHALASAATQYHETTILGLQ
jgi:hypothetical protein